MTLFCRFLRLHRRHCPKITAPCTSSSCAGSNTTIPNGFGSQSEHGTRLILPMGAASDMKNVIMIK